MKKYYESNKKSILWFAIGLLVILVTSLIGSLIQSSGGSIKVSDLRNETNTGTVTQTVMYKNEAGETKFTTIDTKVSGKVVSGILYVPNSASETNKLPAVVLTHGYLNNREHQLPFAIELARRGFVVLTVDREGHGNYNNVTNSGAMMATNGLYDSAKYVYNLPFVDKTKVGITGHSMGGYTTAMTLYQDAIPTETTVTVEGKKYPGNALGMNLISAGLMQGWSTYIYSGANVSVGMLKATDDEFFFKSKDCNDKPTISRQFLHSQAAASFVKVPFTAGQEINIKNGAHYINGVETPVELGTQSPAPFRAIYEADEIHPLNHWSIPSTANLLDFFYGAFGTPTGFSVISNTNQVWWVKEAFSFIGMLALFSIIIPAVSLLLTVPYFSSLKVKTRKQVREDGSIVLANTPVTPESIKAENKPIKGVLGHVLYWLPAAVCTIFSGFVIESYVNEWGDRWFPNTQLYPQDTTNWVALWSLTCGLFALVIILLFWAVKAIIAKIQAKRGVEVMEVVNPLETARVSSLANAFKTVLLALIVVVGLYLLVFANWSIFMVDFRLWTLCIKVFNVPEMVPTACRYLLFFLGFYICNGIANQTYRTSSLPEWASIAINCFFNVFGIALVMIIQYATFKGTGVLWQSDMALGYIVLFPIVPLLVIATILSRLLYKKTGNIYLGSLINALLFTMITVSGTAASFAYVLG